MSGGIPKIIHYCWFGRNPLPESAHKCINSWKKFFPDYEIKEWNEDNFDVNSIPYTREAYAAKKYAFVSDYARFKILYEHGGLYFDTDVEVIKPMEDIIAAGPFMGIEVSSDGKNLPLVNPGLGLGAEAGNSIYRQVLDYYKTLHFLKNDGTPNPVTVVKHTTKILTENGLKNSNDIQSIGGIWIYPKEYFNPFDSLTGIMTETSNTRTIHWYTMSWLNQSPFRVKLSRLLHRVISPEITSALKKRLRTK